MTMKLISAVFAGFLGMAVMACGNTFVIDNFSCPDSVSATGPAVFTFSQSRAQVPLAEHASTT
jgi:hypothetical protein